MALILIPQSLAYAVLAGMPPATGLTVGAVATIAAAPFVSSPFLQTGPVAITGLLTFGAVSGYAEVGSAAFVGLAALLAMIVGAIRLAVGAFGVGAIAYVMSRPVLAGFVPAAGLVIAVGQLPDMLGVATAGRAPVAALTAAAEIGSWDPAAGVFAVATVLVVVVGRRVHPLVPAVLVAVVAGVVVSRLTGYTGPVVGDLPAAWPVPDLALPWSRAPELLGPAFVVALVGFAEPAAIARTYARRAGSPWDADREFFGQGVANLAAGAFGGFPAGGSFSRSAVAVQAGARTPWTGLVTGALVLLAMPVVQLLAALPTAVLGGIIFASVLSLLRPTEALELRRRSRQQFVIAVLTYLCTVVLAPQVHVGVIIGVVLAVAAHLRRESHLALPAHRDGATLHVTPTGVLFFGSAHHLEEGLDRLLADHSGVRRVVLHMDRLGRADVTGALVLRELIDRLRARSVAVEVTDVTPTSEKILNRTLDRGTVGDDPRAEP